MKTVLIARWGFALLYVASTPLAGCAARAKHTAKVTESETPLPEAARTASANGPKDRYMGINIGSALDWEGNRIFADAIKSARPMKNAAGSANAKRDADGWPQEDFSVIVWHGTRAMQGNYALSFTGTATVSVGFGSATLSPINYDKASNRSTATLSYDSTDGSGLSLTFAHTKRSDVSAVNTGITNVKLMRPVRMGATTSYPTDRLLSDQFVEAAKKFRGIRFMDFTATNGKVAEDKWSKRTLPSYPSQGQFIEEEPGYGWQGRGAAWEYVVLIANELNVDAWICIPVAVDDAYITNVAKVFRYGSDGVTPYAHSQAHPTYPPLKPGLALYVEYANELWNSAGAFQQFGWNRQQAIQEADKEDILDYDGNRDEWVVTWRRIAKRTVEISNLFRAVFGDDQMMTTVRPVFLWQQGNDQSTAFRGLDFIDGYYNNGNGIHVKTPLPVSYFIYGGSGSAYYGPNNSSSDLTLSNIWTSDSNDVELFRKAEQIDASWAAAFGLKRSAYEGGPSMDATGNSEAVKEQAWNDSRMKLLVISHQTVWEEYGGDELFYFQFGGGDHGEYYQWNVVKDLFDPVATSPKFQAIIELASGGKSVPAIGAEVSTPLKGADWSVVPRDWGEPSSDSLKLVSSPSGSEIRWASYNFRTTSAGTHRAVVEFSGNGELDVFVDDRRVDRISVTGGGSHTSSTLNLEADLHAIRLNCRSGSVTVETVTLQ